MDLKELIKKQIKRKELLSFKGVRSSAVDDYSDLNLEQLEMSRKIEQAKIKPHIAVETSRALSTIDTK